jgi:plastocyanin
MFGSRKVTAVLMSAGLLLMSAGAAVAQDDATMDMEGLTIDVGGVEYAFTGLPASVPRGTTLTFTNNGVEIHELALNRVADGVTESFEELMALNENGVDLEAEGYIDTDYGYRQLFAVPGQTAEGSITLDQEGRYVALCYIPSGLEMAKLEELGIDLSTLGPDTDPSTLPPEAQEFLGDVMGNPPHLAQGMIQEFVVTAEGTEVGPLPAAEEPAA